MSLLSLACSLLFSLGLRLRGRHALFPPRGEEKKEEVKPERHASASVPAGVRGDQAGQPRAMFLFFSNRLGCFGSLLVSAAITLVLLVLLNVI
jgi:hypothetical protein